MTFNPERQAVNQQLQFGLEATNGVNVAATKLLQCFDIVFGPMADVTNFTPTGRKYPSVVIENSEWVEGTMTGVLDYNGIVYALAGVCGAPTIGAALSSTTAKSWAFSPPVTGSVQPQTYTIEQGSSTRAHKVNYGLFTEFGYKGDRKAGFTLSGKLIAQALQDGITLTASPTAVALSPSAGNDFNVYLDTTSVGLGTTLLAKALSVDYAFGNIYGPFFPLNRANLGFTSHVDLKPSATIKVLLEADAVGMGQLAFLQSGATQFLRVSGQGLQIAADGPGAVYANFQHDMAVKVSKPAPFQDKDGVFASEWEFQVVEDATWGKAQLFTVQTLLTAL